MDQGDLRVENISPRAIKTPSLKLLDQPCSRHLLSPVRQGKLPPLCNDSGQPHHPTVGVTLLQQSKEDVEEAMKHLLTEVSPLLQSRIMLFCRLNQ